MIRKEKNPGIIVPHEKFYAPKKPVILPVDKSGEGRVVHKSHDPHAGTTSIKIDPEELPSGAFIPGTSIKHEGGNCG